MTLREERYRNIKILWLIFLIIVVVTIIFIRSIYNKSHRGTPLDSSAIFSETINFDADDTMKARIEENYIRYLNKAYILIGTYPDCEYIKISANVERNDYNWSTDFRVPEGALYYRYFKDGTGEPGGKVAIDVSQYQGNIDWSRVKSAGVDVAIVRVGFRGYGEEGNMREDDYYAQNLSGAIEAGISTGVYFFSEAINEEEGIEEANFVLERIKGYDIKEPVVIDSEFMYEVDYARANDIPIEDRTAAIVGFCETVKAAGYTPMVYASRDWFVKNMDIDQVGQYELWLAAYDTPVFPYHTEGYQYSPYGYVDGIESQVDLDVWMR